MSEEVHQHRPRSLTLTESVSSLVSGGIAGAAAKTVVAPIERIKFLYLVLWVLHQTRSKTFSYRSAYIDLHEIISQHGLLNLWRGNLMNVLRIFPQAALDFATFDYLRNRFYHNDGSLRSRVILFLCGAAAGFVSSTVMLPVDFLRVRMAMEKGELHYKSYKSMVQKIYRQEGVRGFYRGYVASISGIVLIHGSAFFIFTKLKEYVKRAYPKHYRKWYVDVIIGFITSGGQFFAYPIDMVKKRMQGQGYLKQYGEIPRILSYPELISKMYGEGIRAFYKGFTLNIFKTPIALSTAWAIKNELNRRLDGHYDF